MSSTKYEYVYIIRERDTARLGDPIYKIGRTVQLGRRINQYPSGSEIIKALPVLNSIDVEQKLLTEFKKKFTQVKGYGTEYFFGNQNLMEHTFMGIVDQENKAFSNSKTEFTLPPVCYSQNYQDVMNRIPQSLIDDFTALSQNIKSREQKREQPPIIDESNNNTGYSYNQVERFHTRKNNVNDGLFVCDQCHDDFKSETMLVNHINNKPHCNNRCRVCHIQFNNRHAYGRHIKQEKCYPLRYSNEEIVEIRKTSITARPK